MTLQDFITQYTGKTLGYPDGQYVGECLSLVKRYFKEKYNFSPPPSGSNSAYGYWSNFPNPLPQYFKKVERSPGVLPKSGDIPIWKPTPNNPFGHIDICIDDNATTKGFTGFDQNWDGRHAHIQAHDYTNVVGWLTPIKPENEPIKESEMLTYLGMPTEKEAREKLAEHLGEKDGKCDWGNADNVENKSYLAEARRKLKDSVSKEWRDGQLAKAEEECQLRVETKLLEWSKEKQGLTDKIAQYKLLYGELPTVPKEEKPTESPEPIVVIPHLPLEKPTLLTRLITWLKGLL